ncbi:MAG: ParB/RepB/Spo0J family partition protein [Actinobacteria bacterium]|uniref:ParB/RepB/Spo0J family partition protein n=1 Tax=Candidatus Fonsibacter lacus TaxID=2576439 RepID=A0A965LKV8_9PROT|nr:ParB/RepB/Spo0J family partition protein [Candidatus Fonsibacter lacus]
MSTRKGGLGRGLGSLIPSGESKQLSSVVAGVPVDIANLNHIPINSIAPNPRQPRTVFDEEKMAELITSIREVGVLQPPVVRSIGDNRYELIMGERRLRAAKAAFNYTHDELAQKIGRSRPHISNTLRLLQLPPSVQRRVAAGVLSAGHARALLALGDSGAMERLANRIVTEGLSVRAVEEIISVGVGDFLNTRVTIDKATGKSNGKIIIEFASGEDLRRIIEEIEG